VTDVSAVRLDTVVRKVPTTPGDLESLLTREYLITNGLGGYSSATVAGVITRRYHGILVAALPNPLGRMALLNHLLEHVTVENHDPIPLGSEERVGTKLEVPGAHYLTEFRLDAGLPVWRYDLPGASIEKRMVMPHRQNTVHITYRLLDSSGPVKLELRPAVHFRGYEHPVDSPLQTGYSISAESGYYVISSGDAIPPLRFAIDAPEAPFTLDTRRMDELLYRVEEHRGYTFRGSLWTPGSFTVTLTTDRPVSVVASSEAPEVMNSMTADEAWFMERERRRRLLSVAHPAARAGAEAELVLAADQFIIIPAGRRADQVRALAVGDEIRTVIAGYHWFTDWGRDTMISLEGLTLTTGRFREAAAILRAFAHYMRDGLIPNMFPDGSDAGLYHTADATMWFFHAVDRYLDVTGDTTLLTSILPTLIRIIDYHVKGTRHNIGMDPTDGLLTQGEEGYQLTWMDAKVDGWVVTPRRGKPVEINALWYNALCLTEGWVRELRGETEAQPYGALAARVRTSFNERFWYEQGGYLYDIVDGPNDDSTECRPNQVIAISTRNPVLDRTRWAAVMEVVEKRLLTPYGLRSLAPNEPDYKPQYWGDLRTRDAAYHQGTVWAWLIGPFMDAWLKLHPGERAQGRTYLLGLIDHLNEFGVGSIAEIFDAEPPYTPRGCIAQAWSVAEELRCLVLTAEGENPKN
jgi:predicted glycogen debranching enzyme